jgi:hypothetical protein
MRSVTGEEARPSPFTAPLPGTPPPAPNAGTEPPKAAGS